MRIRAAVGGFAVIALLLATAPLAGAQSTGIGPPKNDTSAPTIPASISVSVAQSWISTALNDRTQQLATLTGSVSAAKLLASDRSDLNSLLSTTSSGIAALSAKVVNDTTLAEIRADASTMVVTYRVYAFVTPLVRAVVKLDGALISLQQVVVLEPGIKAAIAENRQAKKSVTSATRIDTRLAAILGNEVDALEALETSLLGLTAANYPASQSTINSVGHSVAVANGVLVQADADLSQIVHLLANASLNNSVRAQRLKS